MTSLKTNLKYMAVRKLCHWLKTASCSNCEQVGKSVRIRTGLVQLREIKNQTSAKKTTQNMYMEFCFPKFTQKYVF